MKIYSNSAVDDMVDKYISKGGGVKVLIEGSLACFGLAICYGKGLKFCLIREVYLNDWSSVNSVRFFNKLPKKYQSQLK